MDWLKSINWQPIVGWLTGHGVRILIILLLAWLLYRLIKRVLPHAIEPVVHRSMKGKLEEEIQQRAQTMKQILTTIAMAVIAIAAVLTILSELGINMVAPLAGLGIAGIAIGFGAQNIVRDFISGFLILIENQYAVGDVVKIADVAGLVEDINLRRTVLRDLDGIVHIIPNGEIRVASNFTKDFSRVNLNVSVGYGVDLEHAISVINRVGKELAQDPQWAQHIIAPPQVLRVDKLGDSGIDIKIVGDTKPIQQWNIMGQLRLRIKKAFDEEGIEIPWPHTKVYFGNSPWPEQSQRDR